MSQAQENSPIIVIGMHRSGTALVTRLLMQLGVFMGRRLQSDEEPMFFLKLNDWLLRHASASWDSPNGVDSLLDNADVRRMMVGRLEMLLQSPWAVSYLGLGNYLKHRDIRSLPIPFGWKDPRNTFTFPLWKDVFPNARVIHVYRHGVDVAGSLQKRESRVVNRAESRNARDSRQRRHWLRPTPKLFHSPHVLSLDYGFSLWEDYLQHAKATAADLGGNALEIQYESLLKDPADQIRKMADFCTVALDEKQLPEMTKDFNADRVYAYRSNDTLRAFADRMRDRLAVYGYPEPTADLTIPQEEMQKS